jgi:D-alanyl-D-alanine carboxypeptidase
MTTTTPRMGPIRNKLAAAAAAAALLTTAGIASASAASASATPGRTSGTALLAGLRRDLSRYLTARRTAEHISAVSLRVTYPGTKPAINLATGTTRYTGGAPVSTGALWQIGSNTKAFTAVLLLKLEARGKLSINDPVGKFLPQYLAWRHITIRQLLDMTSRIPDYTSEPAFVRALAKNPARHFTAAQLISYAVGVPLTPICLYKQVCVVEFAMSSN